MILEKILQPGERNYTISIPDAYSEHHPSPLIIALHFAGHGTPYYGKLILTELVLPALQTMEAIIVAPDCNAPDWANPESERDVLDLLDHLLDEYNIDPNKTLLTGYSMGGMGTWYIAARHQDRFSAALIMAGVPQADSTEFDWKIPLYILHGRADEYVPIGATEIAVEQLKSKDVDINYIALDEIAHFETYRYAAHLRASVPWIMGVWK